MPNILQKYLFERNSVYSRCLLLIFNLTGQKLNGLNVSYVKEVIYIYHVVYDILRQGVSVEYTLEMKL